jgi:hypothetical protein
MLLVVGVVAERATAGGGVRRREDGQRPDARGMPVRGDPAHVAAPVVADQVERSTPHTDGVGQVEHVLDEAVDRVGREPLGRIRRTPVE